MLCQNKSASQSSDDTSLDLNCSMVPWTDARLRQGPDPLSTRFPKQNLDIPHRTSQRDWYFFAKQPASAPHMLRIVPNTVPCVGRSEEHFPDGFEHHLLPFSRFLFPLDPPLPPLLPLPATPRVRISYPSAPSSRGVMTDRPRSAAHPTVFLASPSTPTAAPTTPTTAPTAPAVHNTLPSLSRPAHEQSGARPLVRLRL